MLVKLVGKGTAAGKNQKTSRDRAPKEGRRNPKGEYVMKRTLDANEAEERS